MEFESGAGVEDPYADEDEEETADEVEDGSPSKTPSETENPSRDTSAKAERPDGSEPSEKSASRGVVEPEDVDSIPSVSELQVGRPCFPEQLAEALMVAEFHKENPPVPYATWREGTSEGRSRLTIEINEDIDRLVTQAQQKFVDEYDTKINKADLREFALVVGLMNLEDVFEIAEEWGIQYD